MAGAPPFLFQTDFRQERRKNAITEADVARARAEGRAEGEAEGEARARAAADRDMAALASLLSSQLSMLLDDAASRAAEIEAGALACALTFARGIAGAALQRAPLAEIEALAREALIHARSAPHLAIRIAESEVETVDRLMARLARETGYAGQVVVLGEPEMAPGAARIEWADGGLVVDPAAREAAIMASVARLFGPDTLSAHINGADR